MKGIMYPPDTGNPWYRVVDVAGLRRVNIYEECCDWCEEIKAVDDIILVSGFVSLLSEGGVVFCGQIVCKECLNHG